MKREKKYLKLTDIQCEKKYSIIHWHPIWEKVLQNSLIFGKLGKCGVKHAISTENDRQQRKSSYLLVVVKTKNNLVFLLWHHHGDTNTDFQLKAANFLVPKPCFMFKWQITWNVKYGYTWRSKKGTLEYHTGTASLPYCRANQWTTRGREFYQDKQLNY